MAKAAITDIMTMGPGTLIFDKPGGNAEFSANVTSVTVGADADKGDALLVLSGDTIPGDRTYAWKLSATTYQSLKEGGIIDYSWNNAGKTVPFEFKPKDGIESTVTGSVVIDPVTLGGEVGTKPTSDFEWEIVGTPKLTPAKTVG
ncbi:hypothetical protein ACL1FZ_08560 [Corynebacterium striatum]